MSLKVGFEDTLSQNILGKLAIFGVAHVGNSFFTIMSASIACPITLLLDVQPLLSSSTVVLLVLVQVPT